jgi:hypothetical protein
MFVLELAIGSALVAIGVVALRAIRKRRRPELASDEPEATEVKPKPRRASARGLSVGDVLLYTDSEYWLSGMIELEEEGFALRLFPSPGGPRATFVAQLDEAGNDVAFLRETSEVPDGLVPSELPIGGMRLALKKRGHADVRARGEHLPLTTARAKYTVLQGPGGKTLVVVDFEAGDRLALVGERVPKELYDLLPGEEP